MTKDIGNLYLKVWRNSIISFPNMTQEYSSAVQTYCKRLKKYRSNTRSKRYTVIKKLGLLAPMLEIKRWLSFVVQHRSYGKSLRIMVFFGVCRIEKIGVKSGISLCQNPYKNGKQQRKHLYLLLR